MSIRLARGFTGRDLVVKFAGCHHGHVDSSRWAEVRAAAGASPSTAACARYAGPAQRPAGLAAAFQRTRLHGRDRGTGRETWVRSAPRPASRAHELTEKTALLIFDGVMTGFPWSMAAAVIVGIVRPDHAGKIIGGGLPGTSGWKS